MSFSGHLFLLSFRTLLTRSILCTTKLAQGTSQFYFVLPSLHKVLPPSHKQGSPHRRGDVVMLVMLVTLVMLVIVMVVVIEFLHFLKNRKTEFRLLHFL